MKKGLIYREIVFIFVLFSIFFLSSKKSSAINLNKPLSHSKLTVWTSKEGLPSNSITDILQDSKGYIWVATFNGLVRFDGINFEIIKANDKSGFTGNLNTVLLESSDGSIWIGTNGDGLAKYKDGKFRLFTVKNGLSGNSIKTLYEDKEGKIWVGTTNGLSIISGNGEIIGDLRGTVISDSIENIYCDRNDKIWISLSKGGVLKLTNGKFYSEKRFKGVKNYVILSMLVLNNNEVWFGTRENGLFIYRSGKMISKKFNFKIGTINKIKYGSKGCIWISSDSGLLRYYKNKFNVFSSKNGLNDNLVTDTLEDKEGNIWIATIRGGLGKLSDNKFNIIDSSEGLIYDRVNTVYEDGRGLFWIGTDQGLSIYNGRSFIENPMVKKLKGVRIRHIMQDSKGKMWISTYSDLGVVTYMNGVVVKYSREDGLTGNRCRITLEDSYKNIWIGTGNGLNLLKNGKIIHIKKGSNGIADNYILSVFEDSKKNIWITTNGGGVSVIKGEKIKNFSTADGLSSNVVFRVYEDSEGVLWFTTGYGISRYDGVSFVNFREEQGIPGRAVFHIIEDKFGKFWINSNLGVFYIKKKELNDFLSKRISKVRAEIYNDLDGLPDSPTPLGWVCKDRGENIWFPTLKGVAVIDTVNIPLNKNPPPIFMEKVFIDGKEYRISDISSLNPDYKRITFKYTALSYVIPHKVQYLYKLEGFDVGWSQLTTKREISYTRLPRGEYTFKVKAVNNDGIWSKKEADFSFVQNPEFYQTLWFFLLVFFVFGGLIALILGLRIRNLRVRKKELEALVSERTRELETTDRIVANVNKEIDFEKLLNVLLKQTLKLFPQADKGLIFILNKKNSMYEPLVSIGYEEGVLSNVRLTEDVAYGRYVESGEEMEDGIYILKKFQGIPGDRTFKDDDKLRSLIAMTIVWSSKIEGYFILENSINKSAFTISDAKKMKRIREHALSAYFKARTHQILEEAAITDPLTSLNNRRKMVEIFNSEVKRFERTGKTFVTVMCDIDHFKLFNDKYGHDCGDFVLKKVSDLIKTSIRKQDSVGRWGGEEFLIIYPETDMDGALIISEKIRGKISDKLFHFKGIELKITMTFGVCEFRSDKTVDSCIKDADDALYIGKQSGRNVVKKGLN